MPTYNFKTGGDIEIDGEVRISIDGPAALTPRTEAGYFTVKYLGGSDIYYYPTNTYQIDGVEFEGTLAEFCDAAEAVFPSAGGGGSSEAYPDITSYTDINIESGETFDIKDSNGVILLQIKDNAVEPSQNLTIGDYNNDIVEGGTGAMYYTRSADRGSFSFDTWFDDYTTEARISARASSLNRAFIEAKVFTSGFTGGIEIDETAFHIQGIVEYADNAAAQTAGLQIGAIYRTGDVLKIVHA